MRFRFFISILLLLSLLVVFSSCKDADKPETVPDSYDVKMVENNSTNYRIICSESASANEMAQIRNFAGQLRRLTKTDFQVVTDSSSERNEYELLIGNVKREAAVLPNQNLEEDSFSFSLSGNTIIIAVNNSKIMELAFDKFTDLFAKDENVIINSEVMPMTFKCDRDYKTVTIDNTKSGNANDPYVIEHNGSYYYCWSSNGVKVAKINNLNEISTANGKQVFDAGKYNFHDVWAPELHYIDGNWYIYVAMCEEVSDNNRHRMYCLKCKGNDPTSEFELVGQVTDKTNRWAIDGTVFTYEGELYTVWSGWEGSVNVSQKLYIAHMSNPYTIDSSRVMISEPDAWDGITTGPSVNEGPCAVVVGETVYILFSGNGSWTDDYCIGYLKFSGGDIMNKNDWQKSKTAILRKSSVAYGPGHCSVVKADDGTFYIIYHANLESGSGWGGRSLWLQPIEITESGIPVIKPASTTELKIVQYKLSE